MSRPARRFDHRFRVEAPLADVRAFHARSEGLGLLTPPPAVVRVTDAPEVLGEGDDMRFTIWFGPLPIRWHARIESVSERGFVDRQLDGPFETWVHTHGFEPAGDDATWVVDRIEAAPKRGLPWAPVAWGMWLSLRPMFAYRAWRTKRLLAG